jgi:anti-sigma factor RsiW
MTIDFCKNENLLSALIDDELPQELGEMIRRHLDTCPRCRQRFEDLQKTDTMIRDMATLEPSANFERTFWSKIDNLKNRSKNHLRLISLLTGWRPVTAASAIAAMIVAFLIYTGHHGGLSSEEIFIAQNIELLQDYDLIDHLEMLEQWDIVETMQEPS